MASVQAACSNLFHTNHVVDDDLKQRRRSQILLNTFRNEFSAPINRNKERESRVLVLYTGGTIGMMKNDMNAYVPIPDAFEKYIRRIPYMHDEEYVASKLSSKDKSKFLVLPEVADKARVLYHIKEYSTLLDSCNMAMESWIRIALDIQPVPECFAITDRLCIPRSKSTSVRRVLAIYTGGTVGMKPNENGVLVPVPNALEAFLRKLPYLHDAEYARKNLQNSEINHFLVYPAGPDSCNILYHIEEYCPLLDSSNMTMNEWMRIAQDIKVKMTAETGRILLQISISTAESKIPSDTPSVNISHTENEKRVLVFFVGGKICRNRKAPMYIPGSLEAYLRCLPYMCDEDHVNVLKETDKSKFIPLPCKKGENRILYLIQEYGRPLRSCDMSQEHWQHIAGVIEKSYESYDGFVILHGTDTLAYTASALSFMFENLGKTVIVTGSQIPVFESRSDGRDNILGALVLAGNYVIPEVTVFFRNNLFRGNRTMKKSTDAFLAFDSPNMSPIAKIGINIEVDPQLIFRPHTIDKFRVQSTLNPNVGLLRLFPNITSQAVRAFLQPPIEGVVLQTYGAGNVPSNREDLMEELKAATRRGVLIVNCTQCIEGSVSANYETGMVLEQAGVIPGMDMTPEAALTKLSYVLSKTEWDAAVKCEMMQKNLRGELSAEQSHSRKRSMLTNIDSITNEEKAKLESIMLPALINYYVANGNIEELEALKEMGADFSSENSDFRTPLHVACSEGNLQVVEFLLLNGASVHKKDRYDFTPLMDAIRSDHHDVIEVLVKCGAHLSLTQPKNIGEELCRAAAKDKLERLQSYQVAGADLSQTDFNDNTALHIAALHGNKRIVSYLLDMQANKTAKNILGETPADLARRMNHPDVLSLLT